MIQWVESQPTPAIVLLVFGFWYVLAASLAAVLFILSRRRMVIGLKVLPPTILTPVAAINGLLIAFLAARVWANLDRANADVADEATAIHETLLFADALPAPVQSAVHGAVSRYLRFVEETDWPAMEAGRASLRQPPPPLTGALTALLAFSPTAPQQGIAQQHAITTIDQALAARQRRILLSQAGIAPLQWAVILLLGALMLLVTAFAHMDQPVTKGVGLFIVATALSCCLVLLTVNDRPFSSGGNTVEPMALRQIAVD